jgi:hypothetical protein
VALRIHVYQALLSSCVYGTPSVPFFFFLNGGYQFIFDQPLVTWHNRTWRNTLRIAM